MSRTGRLFALLDLLRARRTPVTAATLAGELGVSERTIYRDIQALAALGAPVDGSAGLGYLLRTGFFMPPLMFGPDELEALVLGARWVKRQGDPALAQAAESALARIATATPKDLRDHMADTSLWVPVLPKEPTFERFLQPAREAIRRQHKLGIVYGDEAGMRSERVVWPFGLAFFHGRRVLAAWCELRNALRHFRVDRIQEVRALDERYPESRHVLLRKWREELGVAQDY